MITHGKSMDVRSFVLTSGFLAFAFPTALDAVDFRSGLSGLVVAAAKYSPAYAALEDLRAVYPLSEEIDGPFEKLELRKRATPREPATQPVQQIARPTQLSRTDHLAQLVEEMQQTIEPQSAVELGEVLVREELAQRGQRVTNPNVREIPTAAGSNILVAKADSVLSGQGLVVYGSPAGQPPPAAPPPRKPADIKKRNPAEVIYLADNDSKPNGNPEGRRSMNGANMNVADTVRSKPKRYIVGGPMTFTGGIAFLGGKQQITVRQLIDELTVSEGFVNLREAVYGLEVENLEGEILLEVRDSDGQVLGQGRANLYDVSHLSQNIANIKNLAIQIKPAFSGVSGTAISAASYGKAKYVVADARLYIDGLEREISKNKASGAYEDETLAPPSTFLIRAQHKNFWPSVALAKSGDPFQLRLFPAGLITALLDLTLGKQEARDAAGEGVIWGRVTYGGRPVTGAQVHVVGNHDLKPVYFTGFLPDKTKTSTTAKGEFAFTRLIEPENILRVSLNGKLFWPTLLPVARRHVTYADLEIEMSRTVEFKSYDAFTLEPKATAFRPLGTAEELYVPEVGMIRSKIDTVKGLTLLEADAGEPYETLRVAVRPGQNEIHMPQIRADWLSKHRPEAIGTGSVRTALVGFVEGDDFEVVLGAGELMRAQNLVYFNAAGEAINATAGAVRGKGGGGFIIYDLPEGLHTVTIFPDRSKKVVTQTVYVDEYATHLTRANLAL